ncbi:hypothetical protein CTAYLR_009770 [Chrysophaeum taylorii]|uniref:Ndc10 domain-containing protein n=1 Tax=Chrysophaeum taylorii TaxID=2483200 RepID=A0AAD7UB12_9STRA|nr:hypothetical protein CTAYLR_009770 [Chrysophaeum taylorii]
MTPSETPGARRDERTSSGAAATATAEPREAAREHVEVLRDVGGPGTRWIKQFREFVAAAPGSTLYGNRIDPDREAYDGGDDLVTPDKCLEFLRFTAGARSSTRTASRSTTSSPRSHYGVAIVLSNHAKDTARRKRQKYLCRHTRALLVGYNDEQHGMLCEYALFDGAPGPTERNKLFRGTRARFAHVVQHVLALRGDSLRKAQLADWLVFQTRSAEGPTLAGCSSFSTTTARRTSRDTPTCAAMRHATNPERCLHFSMALYLFTMWTVLGVRKPNYTPYAGVDEKDGQPIVVREWMDYFLVFDGKPAGRRGKSGPPDPKNRSRTRRCSTRPRACSRMAEAAGVGRDELRQAAHHRQADALSVSYCNDFPMRFIRHSAGFPIDGGCRVTTSRDRSSFPDHRRVLLRRAIARARAGPTQEYGLRLRGRPGSSDDALRRGDLRSQYAQPPRLDHLAECLVQDAALMRKLGKMDDHPMWGFAPFNTKEFADYVERQDAAMKNMPIERLRMTAAAAQERGDTLTAAAINAIYASLCDTHHRSPPRPSPRRRPPRVCDAQSRPEATVVPAGRSTARSGHADPPATPPRRLATEDMADDELMFGMRPLVVADSSTWDEDPLPIRVVLSATTVRVTQEVAQEYFRGVDGGPPVKELERFYGPKAVRDGQKRQALVALEWHPQGQPRFRGKRSASAP